MEKQRKVKVLLSSQLQETPIYLTVFTTEQKNHHEITEGRIPRARLSKRSWKVLNLSQKK